MELKANYLNLNTRCELFLFTKGSAVAIAKSQSSGLLEMFNAFAGDFVTAVFHTVDEPTEQEKDFRKFGKRLDALVPFYTRGPWRNQTINGHTFKTVFTCEIIRSQSHDRR